MKEDYIKEVAKLYHRLLRKNNFFPDNNQELLFYDSINASLSKNLPSEKLILAIETSYLALKYHLRKIIKCDFFYKNYSFWWEEYYTRKQYKEFRYKAIEEFFDNLVKMKVINEKGEINYEEIN